MSEVVVGYLLGAEEAIWIRRNEPEGCILG